MTPSGIRLADFDNSGFERGRSRLVEALWLIVSAMFVASWIPGERHRRALLRLFGARIGARVCIKPAVMIKFPWRLVVGDDSWIGERVWIDNLAMVEIGADCCLSQGAYLCTGSHDWSAPAFDLLVKPIRIMDGAWIAARASVGPGVVVGAGAVLTMGAVATSDLASFEIYGGVPAARLRTRRLRAAGAADLPARP